MGGAILTQGAIAQTTATAPTGASTQTAVRGPGNITRVSLSGQQLQVTTGFGYAQITAYSPSVIRVRMSRQPFGDDFSYAVVGHPGITRVNLNRSDSVVVLQTDSLEVRIRKYPFSIAFYTTAAGQPNGSSGAPGQPNVAAGQPDPRLINEDEPGLGTSWIGDKVTTYKKMQEGERFIGLGEKTGNLDRRGSGYTNWNEDNYGYAIDKDPLYSTIPFYIGIHHGLSYGIFLDNTYQSDFNFGASNDRFSSFGADGGEMNYYFIYQPTVAGIITAYTGLTGRMPMPPLWSLGYQQNRYSYYPETEVLRIAQTLREKKIPADGITLDIHYMDGYRVFTWDKSRFPDPKALADRLAVMGLKLTVIVDPGVKADSAYPVYKSGLAAGVFLQYPDGGYYSGQVWPGWSYFADFTSEKGRRWWRSQIRTYADNGVSGIWNDMNEISTWGQKMPDNVLFDYDGHPTTTLQGHNVFGMQMARSSYEGARAAMNKRPFVLSRSGYAGVQRYSAIWTGDNRAEDDHMLAGVRLLASLGLSGVPFTGMDIGGFTGNPSIGLYTRWMQLGAFIPYFRNHTGFNTKSAEPWTFGEDALDICRNYIDLRYTLLPYLYSTFYEATQDGLPVLRSLAITYTRDPEIYDPSFQEQFCLGNAFMVIPADSHQEYKKIYLPEGTWYNLYTGVAESGGKEEIIPLSAQQLPVYVKGSSIIPMQSLVQSTSEKPSDTLSIHIYKGPVKGAFAYYEDDGSSYDYEKGAFYKRIIRFDPETKTITLDPAEGKLTSKFGHIALVLHGFEGAGLKVNGVSYPLAAATFSFLGDGSGCPVQTCYLNNDHNRMVLEY
jgi:alpha-glucosidase